MIENVTNNSNVRTSAEPDVPDDPLRNRGVAFTLAEQDTLGLTGRLPSGVLTLEEQARRAWQQRQAQGDDLAKNVYGVAIRKPDDLVQAVQDAIWQPAYPDAVS